MESLLYKGGKAGEWGTGAGHVVHDDMATIEGHSIVTAVLLTVCVGVGSIVGVLVAVLPLPRLLDITIHIVVVELWRRWILLIVWLTVTSLGTHNTHWSGAST